MMLGTGTFSALVGRTSVESPNVKRWWFLAARLSKVVFDSLSLRPRYAIKTYSSTDLNDVIFVESRRETSGSLERCM